MKKMFIILAAMIVLAPIKIQAKTLVNMGEFKITAFCPCELCSEGYGRKCAMPGHYARSEHTIAVDPDVISLGSNVKIGDTVYTAEDVGGLVKGDHVDIFFDTHEEVIDFGLKYRNIWIVKD